MNALSIFAGVCIFCSAATVGLWIKRRLIRRAAFYEGYYDYLLFATEKISYERMPIGELNAKYLEGKKGEFPSYLKDGSGSPPLAEDDLGAVRRFLDGIGTTDADTQIASLNAKCAELKRFTENDCAKYRKDAALYFKLSCLIGVAAFILLV